MVNVGETLLSDTTFAVIDLETSGGSPKSGAGITEIGVVKIRGGNVLGTFQSFVDPGHSLPPFITQLTGITDEMLLSAPFIDEVLPTLFEFLGSPDETVLVAHNSPFDMSFLKAAAVIHEYQWPPYATIDTAHLARAVLDRDEVINCKLGTLAEFFFAGQGNLGSGRTIDRSSHMTRQSPWFSLNSFNRLKNARTIKPAKCIAT